MPTARPSATRCRVPLCVGHWGISCGCRTRHCKAMPAVRTAFSAPWVLRLRAPIPSLRTGRWSAHGVFLHRVLEVFLRTSLDQDRRIRHLTEEETVAAADRIMQEYMTELCGDIAGDGRLLHLFARLRAVALMLVRTVQAEAGAGSVHGRGSGVGYAWAAGR